jgi:hypothetical protein
MVVRKMAENRHLHGARPQPTELLEEADVLGLTATGCRLPDAPSAYAHL